MSREAFEKWAKGKLDLQHIGVCYGDDVTEAAWQAWQAAQAQAGQPIAAVHGWFHGECVIRPLDPEAVLPAGMALYSQPQAQAGDGEAVGWQYQHEDTGRTTFVTHAEAAAFEELNPRWCKAMQLYTAPPAAVNQQLPEGYVLVPVEPTEAMIDAGVAVAFAASVHGKGGWNNYMKALYRAFIAAAQEQKL